ncbi:MAG: hypothetical protein KME18_19525 [Phormidium tanganyikae FI6-MK23]|jgi:Fic family protein|nr:hypothetical protein [Phormidium tanganyikae FI6-MK23]
MPRPNARKTEIDDAETETEVQDADSSIEETETSDDPVEATQVEPTQDIDEILNSLKTLLSTVEKLQKVRQEVGDIKPLLLRMLDGELMGGEELEQLKTGVGGLMRLVRAHSDHQTALVKAQSARGLLDEVLKIQPSS